MTTVPGGRVLGEDDPGGNGRVVDLGPRAGRDLRSRERGEGIRLRQPHDGGHADLLGTLADGEGDGRAGLHLAARGGIGLDGLAGGDGGVGLLLGGGHDEAGGRDGGDGVGLGEALDLGHDGERRTGAHGVVDRGARGHRRCRLGGLGEDGVLGTGVLDDARRRRR